MKKLIIIIIIILALAAALVFFRNIIIRKVVSAGVSSFTGLNLTMKSMNVALTRPLIDVKGLKLFNPSGFKDKLMVDMPQMYVDYDLRAFLKKKVHLRELKIHLKEFVVVRNEEGELNLDSLSALQSGNGGETLQEEGKEIPEQEFKIDILHLKIGKVIFKDYSKGEAPKTMEFDVDIDERYENITDPRALARLIIVKALFKTAVARLTNFNLEELKDGVSDILKDTLLTSQEAAQKVLDTGKDIGQKAGETIEGTVDKAADALKKILPPVKTR